MKVCLQIPIATKDESDLIVIKFQSFIVIIMHVF